MDNAGTIGVVGSVRRNDDCCGPGRCKLLAILRIGEEGDLPFPGTRKRGDLANHDRPVAPQLSAKSGNDFV